MLTTVFISSDSVTSTVVFGKSTIFWVLSLSLLFVDLTCSSEIYSLDTYPLTPELVVILVHPFSSPAIVTAVFLVNVVITFAEVLALALTLTLLALI